MSEHDVTITLAGPVAPFKTRDRVEEFLDAIMDHLMRCDVIDPSVSEGYSDDDEMVRIEFSMTIEAAEAAEAAGTAMAMIRASFHALGAATPGWDDVIREMRSEAAASTSEDGNLIPA